jgi:hypothetical protein
MKEEKESSSIRHIGQNSHHLPARHKAQIDKQFICANKEFVL